MTRPRDSEPCALAEGMASEGVQPTKLDPETIIDRVTGLEFTAVKHLELPKRARGRRNETRDLVRPIVVALNRLPGVRVVRNANLGPVVPWAKRFDPGARPVLAGLGVGSADVVGVVRVESEVGAFGRLFCLEVKLPSARENGRQTRRAGTLDADQKRWIESVRRFGGFACVVHGVDEARDAVERCRRGESE